MKRLSEIARDEVGECKKVRPDLNCMRALDIYFGICFGTSDMRGMGVGEEYAFSYLRDYLWFDEDEGKR